MAATLPGADVAALLRTQREATDAQLRALVARADAVAPDGPEQVAEALVVDAMVAAAEAELRWLDRTEERLERHPEHAMPLAPASERPRRGRPTREVPGATDTVR